MEKNGSFTNSGYAGNSLLFIYSFSKSYNSTICVQSKVMSNTFLANVFRFVAFAFVCLTMTTTAFKHTYKAL